MDLSKPNRRTVLKGIGAGVASSAALSGAVNAGPTGDERRQDSFTWAQGELYEMLESEPGIKGMESDPTVDSEGAHESHRPLWVISSMAGTGVPGSEHSPHPNPDDLPIDHVVPLVDFSAQWHVTTVSVSATNPFALTNTDGENYLISADAIRAAEKAGDVHTHPLVNPETGEPVVFTCPVRPHQHEEDRGGGPD